MASPNQTLSPKIVLSTQEILNLSFDQDYKVVAVEMLGEYNSAVHKVQLDSSGNLKVNVSAGGAGEGALLDGVTSSIKATVLDYTNSNPLAVRLTDTAGDYVGAGGGTQYTEDAASAADPIGNMLIGRRRDTLTASEVSADGDNIALNVTNKGQLHVKQADTVIVDGSAVTQPISAASLPLPTGAATSAKQDTGNTSLGTIAGAVAGTEMQVDVLTMPTTTVQATNLDIRDLTSVSDSIEVKQATGTNLHTVVDSGSITADTELTTADLDTGAGTDTRAVVGLVGSKSGGGALIPGDATAGLKVDLGADNDVTVTGSVTANAGTNLNTSALALEAGGNLATIAGKDFATQTTLASLLTSSQLIDDTVYTDGTGTPSKALGVAGTDGTNPQIIKTDTAGELQVDVLTMPTVAVTQSGTWDEVGINDSGNSITVDGTVSANLNAGTNNIGDVDVLTLPATPAGTNAIGKFLPPDIDVTTHTNYAKKYYTNAGAVTDGIIWSPAAGKRWHITDIFINVSAAATVTLEDDKAAGDEVIWKAELAANSGWSHHFDPMYPWASEEDAADFLITTSAGNVYCTVVGYEI